MPKRNRLIGTVLLAIAGLMSNALFAASPEEAADLTGGFYDEAAYTDYVENSMQKLDKLYLDFCATCGVDTTKATQAKEEFLVTVRELMQYMNASFDNLDPKKRRSPLTDRDIGKRACAHNAG